jgi:hypothetical protein
MAPCRRLFRIESVGRDGHGYPSTRAARLAPYHTTSTMKAYGLSGMGVFQHEGQLNGLSEGKDLIRLDEGPTDAEITCRSRAR